MAQGIWSAFGRMSGLSLQSPLSPTATRKVCWCQRNFPYSTSTSFQNESSSKHDRLANSHSPLSNPRFKRNGASAIDISPLHVRLLGVRSASTMRARRTISRHGNKSSRFPSSSRSSPLRLNSSPYNVAPDTIKEAMKALDNDEDFDEEDGFKPAESRSNSTTQQENDSDHDWKTSQSRREGESRSSTKFPSASSPSHSARSRNAYGTSPQENDSYGRDNDGSIRNNTTNEEQGKNLPVSIRRHLENDLLEKERYLEVQRQTRASVHRVERRKRRENDPEILRRRKEHESKAVPEEPKDMAFRLARLRDREWRSSPSISFARNEGGGRPERQQQSNSSTSVSAIENGWSSNITKPAMVSRDPPVPSDHTETGSGNFDSQSIIRTSPKKKIRELRPLADNAPEWMKQKRALMKLFPEGWQPRKKVSREAMDHMRTLHKTNSTLYSLSVLSQKFKISPEAVRRILKSKFQLDEKEAAKKEEKRLKSKALDLEARGITFGRNKVGEQMEQRKLKEEQASLRASQRFTSRPKFNHTRSSW